MEPPQEKEKQSESSRISESTMSTSINSDEETYKSRTIIEGTPRGNAVLRRSIRQIHSPPRYDDYVLMTNIMNVNEPMNYEQDKDKEEWLNL